MKSYLRHLSLFVATLLLSLTVAQPVLAQTSRAGDDEGAYLDPKYPTLIKILPSDARIHRIDMPERSDLEAMIAIQSAVKSQAARGTCSIFSATALLESMMISVKSAPSSIDLSEEWLEYITHIGTSGDGSSSYANFAAYARLGAVSETAWPYVGVEWKTATDSQLATQRCGDVKFGDLGSCLIAHRDTGFLDLSDSQLSQADPEFLAIRQQANTFRDQNLQSLLTHPVETVYTADAVKGLLNQNIPLTMDIDFYYGAWNHREAADFGLTRNMDHWSRGIIGAPEVGSKDVEVSRANPAGHSIVIVGYDDTVVVENEIEMADGTKQTFRHTGVYYIKNSWGTASFGALFAVNGVSHPGYGMITQDYANQYGSFFRMPLK